MLDAFSKLLNLFMSCEPLSGSNAPNAKGIKMFSKLQALRQKKIKIKKRSKGTLEKRISGLIKLQGLHFECGEAA